MYTLVSVNVPCGHVDDVRTPINAATLPLDTLLRAHQRVDVILTKDNDPTLKLWQLDSSMRFTMNPRATIAQVLTNTGDGSLDTTDLTSYPYSVFMQYSDAFQAGYTATPVAPGASPDLIYNDAQMIDLILKKDGIDYNLFNQSCLVSVNGFFRYAQANASEVYVVDGAHSRLKTGMNLIGIHSFAKLGAIQSIRITPEMINSQGSNYTLKQSTYIDTGVDMSNYTVALVLGGYFHVLTPNLFSVVGTSTIRLNMNQYPLIDRIYESHEMIDFSSLQLDTNQRNPTQLSPAQLYGDTAIRAYLSLSSSFVVLINATDLFKYRYRVMNTQLVDHYTSFIDPRYPLTVGFGKISEYWRNIEEDRWALKVAPKMYPYQIYSTTDAYAQQSVSDNQDPYRPGINSPGYFTMLGRMQSLTAAT